MSKFKTEPEHITIIRGKGEVKVRKAEEEQDFTRMESEPEDKDR